jgi:signal transduction histidine kinase
LEVKTITAEVIVTLLNLIALAEIFFSKSVLEVILRSLALLAILIFSIILVRSVKKEIQRREEVTNLAHSLEKANLRLQELDRQKTEFLSIASHQLRTPLSIIKGYIELLKDGAFGKPTAQMGKTLDDMNESNEHLVVLVDEFLNISRIEQGRIKYSLADSDLNNLISGVVREMSDRARQNGFTLVWSPNTSIKKINIDEEKIRHVVFNFVDNAIKYGGRGEIKVLLEKEDGGVAVKVQDLGIGFGAEDEANFFTKFYRGKNVMGTNVNGTGLGLYVCKKFIEAHNGKIWAKSAGLGEGSEFGFWLPVPLA